MFVFTDWDVVIMTSDEAIMCKYEARWWCIFFINYKNSFFNSY